MAWRPCWLRDTRNDASFTYRIVHRGSNIRADASLFVACLYNPTATSFRVYVTSGTGEYLTVEDAASGRWWIGPTFYNFYDTKFSL